MKSQQMLVEFTKSSDKNDINKLRKNSNNKYIWILHIFK